MAAFNLIATLAALYIVFRIISLAGTFVSKTFWPGPLWRWCGLVVSLVTLLAGAAAVLLGLGIAVHLLLIGAAGLLFCDQRHCGTSRPPSRSPAS